MNQFVNKKRFLFLILLSFLFPGFLITLVQLFRIMMLDHMMFLPIFISAFVGIITHKYFLSKIPGLETFEHELTHAIAVIVCFRKVRKFIVTRYRGGCVQHCGRFGGLFADDFICFAPYVLPTLTLIAVLTRPLLPTNVFPLFDVFVGLTFGIHIGSTFRGIMRNWGYGYFMSAGNNKMVQSDLGGRGLIYSIVYILSVTIALYGLLVALVLYGYSGLIVWWNMSCSVFSAVGSKLFTSAFF